MCVQHFYYAFPTWQKSTGHLDNTQTEVLNVLSNFKYN